MTLNIKYSCAETKNHLKSRTWHHQSFDTLRLVRLKPLPIKHIVNGIFDFETTPSIFV